MCMGPVHLQNKTLSLTGIRGYASLTLFAFHAYGPCTFEHTKDAIISLPGTNAGLVDSLAN